MLSGVQFGDLGIRSLCGPVGLISLFLQLSLDGFTAECEVVRLRVNLSKSEPMVLCWNKVLWRKSSPSRRVKIPLVLVHK